MKTADVFVLTAADGTLLPPAVQATVLAKYSRSPDSARELMQKVTPEDAATFQAKWGVTYGHSSVAELATVPYCFEGVSIIASKFLERYQRAGYSEKSTRYQVFTEDSFVEPREAPTELREAPTELREAATGLYRTYASLEREVTEHVAGLIGGAPIEELVKKAPVKARAFDNLRYLLPAGTGTNLAVVTNARDARYMMSDLLGSRLPELRDLGEKMVSAASSFAPVFAMGAKPATFEPPIRSLGRVPANKNPHARLVEPLGLNCRAQEEDFWARVSDWYGMSKGAFDTFMEGRGKHQVPDIFKTVTVTFDIVMDYGAFRDLQRHRRCEQYIEPLGPSYGYVVPDDLVGAHADRYRAAMDKSFAACQAMLRSTPLDMVQYALPLGTLHRSKFQMDLREVYYLTELRTQPQGHISYRRIAWQLYEEALNAFPTLMKWCRAIRPDAIGEHR